MIIIQSVVKVKENDTEKSLSKRILKEEHRIYPEAVNLFARKKIKVIGREQKSVRNQDRQKSTKL